jgi:hypothetical protein
VLEVKHIQEYTNTTTDTATACSGIPIPIYAWLGGLLPTVFFKLQLSSLSSESITFRRSPFFGEMMVEHGCQK